MSISRTPISGPTPAVLAAGRRQFLAGASAMLVTGCGGGGGGSASPTAEAPAPAPTPTATPTAEVFGPEVVTVGQFYRPEHGPDWQPAYQAAIDFAEANGKAKIVNDRGAIKGEMWTPVRHSPFQPVWGTPGLYEPDGHPLVVRKALALDFRGASFDLKGPGGGGRDQPIEGGTGRGATWRGGWLYVIGNPGFGRVTVENVTVDGAWDGSVIDASAANLSDKGFRIHDTFVKEVYMRNVELRNFGGEIYYTGGIGPDYQHLENCHFHGSAQSAFNGAAHRRTKAINLQAGRAYVAAEMFGNWGMEFIGGRFYDCHHVPLSGGPAKTLPRGHPIYYQYWDGEGEPPWCVMEDVVFENCRQLHFGAWAKGRVKTIDTMLVLQHRVAGDVHAIDLEVESWCDKVHGSWGAWITGPPSTTTQYPGGPPGLLYTKPHDIRLRIACHRTEAARAADRFHRAGVLFAEGLVDTATIDIALTGEAQRPVEAWTTAPIPAVAMSGFSPVVL